MDDQQAQRIADNLPGFLLSRNPDQIREAFRALVFLDGQRIRHLAEPVIAETDIQDLLEEFDGDLPQAIHRFMMDVFVESVLETLREKAPEVDTSVEHDAASWIEANAAAITAANIGILEAALPHERVPVRRTLIEFHHQIDFEAWEADQNATIQSVWGDIETQIKGRLANASTTAAS